jgi:hypothetical protein
MVIFVHGAVKVAKVLDENDITSLLKSKIKEGLSSKDAIAKVASENSLREERCLPSLFKERQIILEFNRGIALGLFYFLPFEEIIPSQRITR